MDFVLSKSMAIAKFLFHHKPRTEIFRPGVANIHVSDKEHVSSGADVNHTNATIEDIVHY